MVVHTAGLMVVDTARGDGCAHHRGNLRGRRNAGIIK